MEKWPEKKSYFKKSDIRTMIDEERHLGRENLSDYLALLRIEEKDLKDKIVLDVGSSTGKIVEQMNEIGAKAFGIDPIYSLKEGREILKTNNNLVSGMAGDGNNFPFKNNEFDFIVNNFSAFNYAKTKEVVDKNFEEQLKLIKKGGSIYIFPLKWSFNLNDYVIDLEKNFIEDEELVTKIFLENISKLKNREDLEVFFGEPDYKKLGNKIEIPLHKHQKIYYVKIKKIKCQV